MGKQVNGKPRLTEYCQAKLCGDACLFRIDVAIVEGIEK